MRPWMRATAITPAPDTADSVPSADGVWVRAALLVDPD